MNRRQCRSSVIRSAVVSPRAASLAAQVAHAADERIGGSHENDRQTASPIKHVIVIVGENRTFDHIFATYQPPPGEHVDNLLSKGIVNIDGSPGPNYGSAAQNSALNTGAYSLAPGGKTPYNQTSNQLQAPGASDPPQASYPSVESASLNGPGSPAPLAPAAEAPPALLPQDLPLLLSG